MSPLASLRVPPFQRLGGDTVTLPAAPGEARLVTARAGQVRPLLVAMVGIELSGDGLSDEL